VTSTSEEAALSTYETKRPATESHGTSAAEKASATVQQATGATREKAQQATGQARSRVRDQVDQRSTQAGERVAGVARDARSVGEHLRSQGKERPATLADQAADRAERLGDYLKRADGDAILRDVERFGRERPWAVMAGGLVLGVAASRFLKASSSRRYREMESVGNLPGRPADVARGTPPSAPTAPPPSTATGAAPAALPSATMPVPGAPERDLSPSGSALPNRPSSGPTDR
jgi:hypothetical protein